MDENEKQLLPGDLSFVQFLQIAQLLEIPKNAFLSKK